MRAGRGRPDRPPWGSRRPSGRGRRGRRRCSGAAAVAIPVVCLVLARSRPTTRAFSARRPSRRAFPSGCPGPCVVCGPARSRTGTCWVHFLPAGSGLLFLAYLLPARGPPDPPGWMLGAILAIRSAVALGRRCSTRMSSTTSTTGAWGSSTTWIPTRCLPLREPHSDRPTRSATGTTCAHPTGRCSRC